MQKSICGVVLFFSLLGATADACSAFQLGDKDALVGKSYDWHQGHGLVMTNSAHLNKTALLIDKTETAESWTASYGSVTFNQHGKEFPLGGMNSQGLVVEILWLDESTYPAQDKRPALNELQWIQYQLDNFASVQEVLTAVKNRRIAHVFAKVHYLVCDTTPECATIEFIDSKEAVHTGKDIVAKVLTNNSYEDSATQLTNFVGFGGMQTTPTDESSLSRFTRLAANLSVPTGKTAQEHALDLLDSVKQSMLSKWHIVYNPVQKAVTFREVDGDLRNIDMTKIDFSCKTNKLGNWFDFASATSGDVTTALKAAAFDSAENDRIIQAGLKLLRFQYSKKFLEAFAKEVSAYPLTAVCEE